ncbi:hypothetical protein [Pseudothauera rhizosphaerae]|uniref:Uncharacterized protein n=1 Tax=Pseudothauera rhizosphaerae TaxID=2565932 RepID=A0A4S4AMR6_9RHOO|nr:hypothetical protein [Pseudothauera rhizosphaerae]THF60353.1 hypothetical protein E6O51_14200 [Pseudothauera rhizosphaerae]
MKPSVPSVLAAVLRGIEDSSRAEQNPVKLFELRILRTVIEVINRDWDGAVPARIAEIDSAMSLLRRGLPLVSDSLRDELQATLARNEATRSDLHLSALDKTIDSLNAGLIDLHEYLEVEMHCTYQGRRELIRDIWTHLEACARRRAVIEPLWDVA